MPKLRVWSTVRGWKPPHVILIDFPEEDIGTLDLKSGVQCQVQYFHQGIIHRFSTEILEILGKSPVSRLISMRYPTRILCKNLRVNPRISIRIPANVTNSKGESASCTILDISQGGCSIKTSINTLSIGDDLLLSCHLPNHKLLTDVRCTVKNAYGHLRYGLEFRQLSWEQQKVLEDFHRTFSPVTASNSKSEGRGGIIGNLEHISLPDLLQVLANTRKAYQIDITDGTEWGQIFINNGEIVHARTSLLKGEDAIFDLFLCPRADCRIQKAESIPELNVKAKLHHLLLDFACRLDEGRLAREHSLLSTH